MVINKQVVGGATIAGVLAIVTLFGSSDASLLVNTASANYGGGGGGSPRVDICHNGQTIKVAKRSVDAHLAHGDTSGKCIPRTEGQVLGASTTANQAKIQELQTQIITLLQQLLGLLKNK